MQTATDHRPSVSQIVAHAFAVPGLASRHQDAVAKALREHARREGHYGTHWPVPAGLLAEDPKEPMPLHDWMRPALEYMAKAGEAATRAIAQGIDRDHESARRAMMRLEDRGAVTARHEGSGRAVYWKITAVGRKALRSGRLPPALVKA